MMIKKLITSLKESYHKLNNKTPTTLHITPEDLAELRDTLKIPYNSNITHFNGLKLNIEPEVKLKLSNENYTGRYLLSDS